MAKLYLLDVILKAVSQRRQTENRSFAKASRCSASVLSPPIPGALLEIPCPPGDGISFKPVESVKFQIGTRISAVQFGNMERQFARLKPKFRSRYSGNLISRNSEAT
jgi:hypothetical protein